MKERERERERVLDVIERYAHGDPDLQFNLASEMRIFKNAELDFGRLVATRERNTVMPGTFNA